MRFWLKTAGWFVAMLVGFEVLCRIALGHAPLTRIDAHYDRITRPNQPVIQASEGFTRTHTNELGHLDAPMPNPLPKDGILVIGDSLTEGRQVAMSERFTDRLGALLGRRVYNVGHTGWSPLNAIGFLGAELHTFEPATVIVQVSGNDLDDIVTKKRPHVVEQAGHFEIAWPKREKKGTGAKIAKARELVSHSALANDLIVRAMMMWSSSDEDGGGAGTCEKPDPLAIRAAPWILDQLHAAHPDVRLLYLPVLDYHASCVDKCAAGREVWRSAAAAAHVQFVDVSDAMCRQFRETRQPLNGFWNTIPGTGHLNADGHAVVASELAAALRGTAAAR